MHCATSSDQSPNHWEEACQSASELRHVSDFTHQPEHFRTEWLHVGTSTDYIGRVTNKSRKISAFIEPFLGRKVDAHYAAYFDCFNRQLFFEAHDVLEQLWLAQRTGPNYAFHKGLIQLAGAFVHLQKNRLRPAALLFALAEGNLRRYPPVHEGLDLEGVLEMIRGWLLLLEQTQFKTNPLSSDNAPKLKLEPRS